MEFRYKFNEEHLPSVMALCRGEDGPEITGVDNPDESDELMFLAVTNACTWMLKTYGEEQLLKSGLLIPDGVVH